MAFTTLIDTETLARHLDDPELVPVDCRYSLDDESWGKRDYVRQHIRGAVYADLGRQLSGKLTGRNGRHPLPDPFDAERIVGELGIGNRSQVVAYDQDSGTFASRLWWMLRWLGHDLVAVLDGGLAKWLAEGRDTVAGENPRLPQPFHASVRGDMAVDVQTVLDALADRRTRLIDARSPERYRGEVEPIDRVPGHIPGAVNRPFRDNLNEGGTFKPVDELRRSFVDALGGVSPDRAICYCGSGVTACHNLLALEHAGMRGAKLYPGSRSEWSSDATRPVGRGDD